LKRKKKKDEEGPDLFASLASLAYAGLSQARRQTNLCYVWNSMFGFARINKINML
jgi:hypothetical protein